MGGNRTAFLLAFLALLLGVAAWSALSYLAPAVKAPPPVELTPNLLPAPKPLAPFVLTDHKGAPFTNERLQGRWTFLFFGYTYCPDVCPLGLSVLSEVFATLAPQKDVSKQLQTLFVSVDPERDTPELLRGYLPYFNPDFIGASGRRDALDAFVRQVGAMYVIHKEAGDDNYLVSHTSTIFLIDPQGRLVGSFSSPLQGDHISATFLKIRTYLKGEEP